jgi:hypothetical protein
LEGCPDQDGDGIADNEDNCPDESGSLENNGCPDSDEDGLIDSEDNCPNEIVAIDNDGCPWPVMVMVSLTMKINVPKKLVL